MKDLNKLIRLLMAVFITVVSLAGTVSASHAQDGDGLDITVTPEISCSEVEFTINWTPTGADGYMFYMDFGDGDTTGIVTVDDSSIPMVINHSYPSQGDFEWSVEVDSEVLTGTLTLAGPEVSLTSVPFPPLFVAGDEGLVNFSTAVTGGTPDYTYEWDLDGDGVPEAETGETASFTYSDVDKYSAQVAVTDSCGFSSTASLPVVVADPEDACHPMAQKIADGVNTLFPDQSGDLYTCEDIYTLFDNESEENNLGFGRMWMAYKLAGSMDLSWEEILAWHLDESGWGSLLQLNRFSQLLEEQGIGDLTALVLSGDYSLGDVRTAVRSVTHFDADFEDALTRVAEGATPGELNQFYKLAGDLEAEPEILDGYLAEGMTLAELKHAASFADRMDADWTEIAEARASADSWGDLKQAYSMASEDISAAEILTMGVQVYRKSLQEEQKAEKQDQANQVTEDKNQKIAARLAEQYSLEIGEVMNMLNGEDCQGDWACVRSSLREQVRNMTEGLSEKDYQTALQISAKYGFSEEEVLAYHQESCESDWACTRAYYRNMYMDTETHERGKSNK